MAEKFPGGDCGELDTGETTRSFRTPAENVADDKRFRWHVQARRDRSARSSGLVVCAQVGTSGARAQTVLRVMSVVQIPSFRLAMGA